MPEKRIVFAENLYRVLYLEMRGNYLSFEGIWDPIPILQDNCMKTLQMNQNLGLIPLWEKLEPGIYSALVTASETAFNAARTKCSGSSASSMSAFMVEWINYPPYNYLKAQSLEEIRSLRQSMGIEYILEISLAGISVTRVGPTKSMTVLAYGRLIRLSDGAIMWLNKGSGLSLIKGISEFSELEANNLVLLKNFYEKAVLKMCDIKYADSIFRDFVTK